MVARSLGKSPRRSTDRARRDEEHTRYPRREHGHRQQLSLSAGTTEPRASVR
jgi:hypothetical protein